MKAVEGRRGWSHTSPFEAPLGKHHYPAKPWILEPSIGWYQSGCQFGGVPCAVHMLCARCAKSRLFSTTSSYGSQGPEFCTLQPLLVH